MTGILRNGHGPVQTSAVVVLGGPQRPTDPPPSPPTPSISPPESALCDPIDALSLKDDVPSASTLTITNHFDKKPRARDRRLGHGLHVLKTEAMALRNLTKLYESNELSRDGFDRAVEAIVRQEATKGKLVVIGVGKSGHIGQKLVATFKSLAIHAVFLHPTEALHGDLGIIGPHDTLMFITFSGKTQELLLLLPHLDKALPVILLTSHTRPETCEFMRRLPDAILLPAPIHEPEEVSFGVSAPTTSTTVALALGDALAIAAAKELHLSVSSVFARNHPGGAIGASPKKPRTILDISIPVNSIPRPQGLSHASQGVDLLRAGYESATGWVRVGDGDLGDDRLACPGRIKGLSSLDLFQRLDEIPGLLLAREHAMTIPADTSIHRSKDMLRDRLLSDNSNKNQGGGLLRLQGLQGSSTPYVVMVLTEFGDIAGVLETDQLLNYKEA